MNQKGRDGFDNFGRDEPSIGIGNAAHPNIKDKATGSSLGQAPARLLPGGPSGKHDLDLVLVLKLPDKLPHPTTDTTADKRNDLFFFLGLLE